MKIHYCLLCKKLKTCIKRHWNLLHAEEPLVKDLSRASPKKQAKLCANLRKQGDELYNKSAPIHKRIITRQHVKSLVAESKRCSNCLGIYARRNFSRHYRKCKGNILDRRRNPQGSNDASECVNTDDDILKKNFSRIADDEIGITAKNDETMKILAVDLVSGNLLEQKLKTCRSQLRRCARLLMAVKEMDKSITCLKMCITPEKYKLVTAAIRKVCRLEAQTSHIEGHMNLALQYWPLLTRIANRLRTEFIRKNVSENDPELISLKNFEILHATDFKIEITRLALVGIKRKKKRFLQLPKVEDIEKFTTFIKKEGQKCYTELKNNGFTFDTWTNLGKSLLCEILLFNRRRVGEISRILLSDFEARHPISEEDKSFMSRLELILANKYQVMRITGKRERSLMIFLEPSICRKLTLYTDMRQYAEIPPDNDYLFAYPNVDGHLDASVAIRNYSKLCGADIPTALRSTKLRQHIATMAQMISMSDNEMQQLSSFMGHDFKVHLQNYRQSDAACNVTKLSRFFSIVGTKDIYNFKNKTLEDLLTTVSEDEEDNEDDCTKSDEEDDSIHAAVVSLPQKRRSAKKSSHTTPTKSSRGTLLPQVLNSPTDIMKARNKQALSTRIRWKPEEIKLVKERFGPQLQANKTASRKECYDFYNEHREVFQGRSGLSIYMWIIAQNKKLRKR